MPEYLVLWRRSARITGDTWVGPNTGSKQVEAATQLAACEAYDASYGEYLVLRLAEGERFTVARTIEPTA